MLRTPKNKGLKDSLTELACARLHFLGEICHQEDPEKSLNSTESLSFDNKYPRHQNSNGCEKMVARLNKNIEVRENSITVGFFLFR